MLLYWHHFANHGSASMETGDDSIAVSFCISCTQNHPIGWVAGHAYIAYFICRDGINASTFAARVIAVRNGLLFAYTGAIGRASRAQACAPTSSRSKYRAAMQRPDDAEAISGLPCRQGGHYRLGHPV